LNGKKTNLIQSNSIPIIRRTRNCYIGESEFFYTNP